MLTIGVVWNQIIQELIDAENSGHDHHKWFAFLERFIAEMVALTTTKMCMWVDETWTLPSVISQFGRLWSRVVLKTSISPPRRVFLASPNRRQIVTFRYIRILVIEDGTFWNMHLPGCYNCIKHNHHVIKNPRFVQPLRSLASGVVKDVQWPPAAYI